MHTQNSQVENKQRIIINFADSRILKCPRIFLTRLYAGKTKWEADKKWNKYFNINNHSTKFINPLMNVQYITIYYTLK